MTGIYTNLTADPAYAHVKLYSFDPLKETSLPLVLNCYIRVLIWYLSSLRGKWTSFPHDIVDYSWEMSKHMNTTPTHNEANRQSFKWWLHLANCTERWYRPHYHKCGVFTDIVCVNYDIGHYMALPDHFTGNTLKESIVKCRISLTAGELRVAKRCLSLMLTEVSVLHLNSHLFAYRGTLLAVDFYTAVCTCF